MMKAGHHSPLPLVLFGAAPSDARPTDSAWFDRLGSVGSLLCAIHCVVVALAPGLLVGAGLGGLLTHEAEWGLTGFAVSMGLAAAFVGYRVHGSRLVALLLVGLALALVVARVLEQFGADGLGLSVAIVAGVGIAITHLVNLRSCRSCSDQACATK